MKVPKKTPRWAFFSFRSRQAFALEEDVSSGEEEHEEPRSGTDGGVEIILTDSAAGTSAFNSSAIARGVIAGAAFAIERLEIRGADGSHRAALRNAGAIS